MLLTAIGMSYLAVKVREARRQKHAAEVLERAGMRVETKPTWLAKVLGDDSLIEVTTAYSRNSSIVHSPKPSPVRDDWFVLGVNFPRNMVVAENRNAT